VTSATDPALIPPRWRLPARLLFLAVAALTVLLFAGGLPEYYRQLTTLCPAAACPNSPTAAMAQTYQAAGISIEAAARWTVGVRLFSALVSGLAALLIFWRRPDNRMAWFTAFTLLTFGAWGIHDTAKLNTVLAVFPAIWHALVYVLAVSGGIGLTLFFFIFPDGRVQPRGMRLIVLLLLALQVLGTTFPGSVADVATWPPPLFLAYWFVLFGLMMYAQVYRYQRVSTYHQRQQTKWVVLGVVAALMGTLALLLLLTLAPVTNPVWQAAALFADSSYYLGLQLLPLSIGFAMFRSGLYDVDVVINRALTYGALTVLLAAIYAGLIIGSQALLTQLTGQTSDLALIASTLAVVALFQPLRRGVQGFVDQRFYRRRYNDQQVLTAFAGALRDHPYTNPDDLSAVLVNLVDATVKPTHIALRLVDESAAEKPRG
jgi:hypothetical protein